MVIAGLLCILAALTGAVLWVDGKPRALLQSTWLRLAFALVGAALVAGGVWQERVLASAAAKGPDNAVLLQRLEELERKSDRSDDDLKALHSEVTLYRSTIDRLAADSRVGAIQATLAALYDSTTNVYCQRNAAAVIPVEWSADEQAACARAINTFWPVEVVVPIKGGRERLRGSLHQLKVPLAMADSSAMHPGLTAAGLGIVFPEGTPHTLLCAIRTQFKANTGRDLTTLAVATDYLNATKQPVRLTTIQVGVWFGEHFASALSSYRQFSEQDWLQVCTEDGAQFLATVRERFASLAGQLNGAR